MDCSVIIPYFNRFDLLVNTLKSFGKQDYPFDKFELVIIDDGSDENISDNLEKACYPFRYKYFYYPRSEKSCASFARNRGSDNAPQGELLVFLDCDQIVNHNFVREHVEGYKEFGKEKEVMQIGTRKFILPEQDVDIANLKSLKTIPDIRFGVFEALSCDLQDLEGNWHLAFSNNISVLKSAVEKYGGFDEGFKGWGLEDCEFAYRLKKNGVALIHNPEIEVHHQYHPDIYDENRFIRWNQNLEYFCEKYDDLPVLSQKVFADFFDPTRREAAFKGGVKNVWLDCFLRFEEVLRSGSCVKRVKV